MSRILHHSLRFSLLKLNQNALRLQNTIVKPVLPCLNCFSKYTYSVVPKTVDISDERVRYSRRPFNRLDNKRSVEEVIENLDETVKKFGRLSFKEVENALEEVKSSGSVTATQSLMLIRCCGNLLPGEPPEKRTELAKRIWQTLQDLGVTLDISHYNALLRVFVENEHQFVPTDILAEIKNKGLEPNRITCQRLITRYCQAGDIVGATRILEYMREKDMPINVTVFNALILGHSRANDMESAEGILNVMKDAGVEPTSETYTLLICGYINAGNMSKVDELLSLCETKDIVFTNKDYFDIIYAYVVHGYENEVDKILAKIRKIYNYNQDAYNFICKLILSGKPETAYKILKSMNRITRMDGTGAPVGNFFIQRMITSEQPTELILKYCKELIQENLNPRALEVALENSLRNGKESIALALMKEAKENGTPIRQHYFWPLIIHRGKKNDIAGILNILCIMNDEFKLIPSLETVRKYVIPYVLQNNVDIEEMLLDLKTTGVSIPSAVSAVVSNLLLKNDLKKAADLAENFYSNYQLFLIKLPLVKSFLATKDIDSFVKMLGAISASIYWRNTNPNVERTEGDENIKDYREVVGSILESTVQELMSDKDAVVLVEKILQRMLEAGIGISPLKAKMIENILGEKLPLHLQTLLNKLTSEEYAAPPAKTKSVRLPIYKLSEDALERLHDIMVAKGHSTLNIKRKLVVMYARDGDLDKMYKFKNELEAENGQNEGMYALMINNLLNNDKVDEALEIYQSQCEKIPEFSLDTIKSLRLALALVERENYDEALAVLTKKLNNTEVVGTVDRSYTNILCWRILNSLAVKGQVEKVKQFFDVLEKGRCMDLQNITLSPLVKVHAKSGDWEAALKEFENLVQKYKVTPWKTELLKHFIEVEDPANLQKITDLSSEIHGERNSLCDLAFVFIECGRPAQAKKILETPGVQMSIGRLINACNRCVRENAKEHLLSILEVTKNISSLDKSAIYDSLLTIYAKENDYQKALDLWTDMQDQDITPSDDFLIRLDALLKENDIVVPFAVPMKKEFRSEIFKYPASSYPEKNAFESNIRNIILSGNIDKALEMVLSMSPKNLKKRDWVLMIDTLLKNGRYSDAKRLLLTHFDATDSLPTPQCLKHLLKTAAESGDVDIFENISKRISNVMKRKILFDNFRSMAYIKANRTEELVSRMESELKNINTEKEFISNFPRSSLVLICINKPEYVPRIETLIKSAMEKFNSCTTIPSILWMLYMSQKNFDKAEEIWKKYLENDCGFFKFGVLLEQIRKTIDNELFLKTLSFFEDKSRTEHKKCSGLVYAAMINGLVYINKVEEALRHLEESLKTISIEDIPVRDLLKLQRACIQQGISFPYNIPAENRIFSNNAKNDYDSSDSD